MRNIFLTILFVFGCVLVLVEICLRVSGKCRVYSEANIGRYVSGYEEERSSWYCVYSPDITFTPIKSEFDYSYHINQWGLREREVSGRRNDTAVRILVLGDSFAEGLGAPYDSTWPRLIENFLINEKVEVVNAGVAGSDLFYEYVLYRDKLHTLNPDIVIVSMNASDYSDYIFRGGMERFKQDGTVCGKKAPWHETLYRFSHFYRALMLKFYNYTYTGILMSHDEFVEECRSANKTFLSLLQTFSSVVENYGSSFVFITHCNPTEIIWAHEDLSKYTLSNLKELNSLLRDAGICSFDISDALISAFSGASPQQYSYLKDRHYNSIGYNRMAQIIADSMSKQNVMYKRFTGSKVLETKPLTSLSPDTD